MNIFQPKTSDVSHQLWRDATKGDPKAFEKVVLQNQSAVSAVAFSIVGDFSISQDIAQETFLAAWSARESLRDSSRLRAWLCGIARNLARQWRRKKSRDSEVQSSPYLKEPSSDWAHPTEDLISQEEESFVWKALEEIPQNYREVLVLYYREDHSIEQVCQALEISNSAARQRLVRGREMLRNRVSNLVEGVLDRSNPSRSFAARVMAGIFGAGAAGHASAANAATVSVVAKTTTASVVAKSLAAGSVGGVLGGLLGVVGGLGGAWLGTWVPAQFAEAETERQLLLERGRRMMKGSVIFTLAILASLFALAFVPGQVVAFFIAILFLTTGFVVWTLLQGRKTQRLVSSLRKEISPEEDPSSSKLAANMRLKFESETQKYWGRSYQSSLRFLGLPLVDIQISDPLRFDKSDGSSRPAAKTARGWIAIGDVAKGVLLAVGGRAVGGVAFGGVSAGVFSFGGVSLGVVSFGGLAIGLLMAFGGAAVGYDACGGGAIGWNSAAGGGAIAYHAAAGGAAVAWDYAIGGVAVANEANTKVARQVIEAEAFMWVLENQWIMQLVIGIAVVVPSLMMPLYYSRKAPTKSLLDNSFSELSEAPDRTQNWK